MRLLKDGLLSDNYQGLLHWRKINLVNFLLEKSQGTVEDQTSHLTATSPPQLQLRHHCMVIK